MKIHTISLIILLPLFLTSCLTNGINGPITNNNNSGSSDSGGDGSSYGIFSLGKKKNRHKKSKYYKNKKSKYGYNAKSSAKTSGLFGISYYGSDNDSYYVAPKKKTSYYGSSYHNNYHKKPKKKSSYYNKSKSYNRRK